MDSIHYLTHGAMSRPKQHERPGIPPLRMADFT